MLEGRSRVGSLVAPWVLLGACAQPVPFTCVGADCDLSGSPGPMIDAMVRPDAAMPPGASGWTWIAGVSSHDPPASYGTLAMESTSNTPGGRSGATAWVDGSGAHLWGGVGTAPGVGPGSIDGWRWSGTAWTWENGPNSPTYPTFGTVGTAAPTNTPGSRTVRLTHDAMGRGWLFGGVFKEMITNPYTGPLTLTGPGNDLWRWDGTNWTLMAGSGLYGTATYGTKGVAAAANKPGGRSGTLDWVDAMGRVWIFGGSGFDSATDYVSNKLNDLWRWDGTSWAWMAGGNARNIAGTYGVRGTAALANTPGARDQFTGWVTPDGKAWVFGGRDAIDGAGTGGMLNDVWRWDGTMWTWIAGGNVVNQSGVYGSKGTAAPMNTPGARGGAAVFVDSAGIVWLFGGYGYDAAGTVGYLGDLWKWDGTTWTWMSGNQTAAQKGSFGTLGVSAPSNTPSGRSGAALWIDAAKTLWLFGGLGLDATGQMGTLGDVWSFR